MSTSFPTSQCSFKEGARPCWSVALTLSGGLGVRGGLGIIEGKVLITFDSTR
jgi:hypothetical protein